MAKYRYKMIPTGHSSSRFGPCDVCGKPATEVHHQIEERQYFRRTQNVMSWTQDGCKDLYGHAECLTKSRR